MGLYLCVFDETGSEVDGVDVGSYADFNFFRDAVTSTTEEGRPGSICPVLNGHSDSDGQWTSEESAALIVELQAISRAMNQFPPAEFNSTWKADVAKTFGITPKTLGDCFFDVDGEPLISRLSSLAETSVNLCQPILFQ